MQQLLNRGDCSSNNPQLLPLGLGHVLRDQQVVAKLLQTSKQLQDAAASVWAGQQHIELHTDQVQKAASFVQWLRKHARLLQSLDLQLVSSIRHGGTMHWDATAEALAAALQGAADEDEDALQALQNVSLTGDAAGASVLQALAAAQLTQLTAELHTTQYCRPDAPAIRALSALTSLRSLDLRILPLDIRHLCTKSGQFKRTLPAIPEGNALAPLAGLQQLTRLQVGPVYPGQLQKLPPQLQQLHVTVSLGYRPQHLLQLAAWFRQYGCLV
jgi:hypothetical protein